MGVLNGESFSSTLFLLGVLLTGVMVGGLIDIVGRGFMTLTLGWFSCGGVMDDAKGGSPGGMR